MITCCPKHHAWSVLGTPPLAKHENRCEKEEANTTSDTATTAEVMARAGSKEETVSSGRSGIFGELVVSGFVQSAEDILDILCEPNPLQHFAMPDAPHEAQPKLRRKLELRYNHELRQAA